MEKTRPPWAWTHWETTIWERSHAANADAEFEIHRRGGGKSPPCKQCIACHQNSPPSFCATGCAWCSAEPRTAVGPPRGAPHAFAVFSRHAGAEARRCGLPKVLRAIVRIAVQYARDTLPFTDQLRERARRPPDYGTTLRDTCGPRAFSHVLQRTSGRA